MPRFQELGRCPFDYDTHIFAPRPRNNSLFVGLEYGVTAEIDVKTMKVVTRIPWLEKKEEWADFNKNPICEILISEDGRFAYTIFSTGRITQMN